MPTLEKTDGGLPRSALRYRPTTADTITIHEYVTGATTPVLPVKRASRVRQPQADDDVEQDALDAAQMGRGSATATRGRRAPTMPKTLPHTPRPKQTTRPRLRLTVGAGKIGSPTMLGRDHPGSASRLLVFPPSSPATRTGGTG